MENFDNYIFRSSGVGNLMTEPKAKKDKEAGLLSDTTKSYLRAIWIKERRSREKEIHTKYTDKGTIVEDNSITLYSRCVRDFFKKNDTFYKNEFVSGTPDLVKKDVKDIKSSFDIFTFYKSWSEYLDLKAKNKDTRQHIPEAIYFYQLQSYMWLTGLKSASLVKVLEDTPIHIIESEKNRLKWNEFKGIENLEQNTDYIKAYEQIENNLIYPDIPLNERYFEIPVIYDESIIEKMKEQIIKARKYLNELDSMFLK